MILDAENFTFKAPESISRARRVLIKPSAGYAVPYPVTTSASLLSNVVQGIRKISDADIVILEGTADGSPVYPIFQKLGYNFPRVITLDVRDTIQIEVENPLSKPLAVPTFWLPNVILSTDYLISIAPLKVIGRRGHLTIMNLLSLLPSSKYDGEVPDGWRALFSLGIDKVLTDLYFTLPFDMGIIEGHEVLRSEGDPVKGKTEPFGKIFIGDPYEVDLEASSALGLKSEYLDLIRNTKVELGT